MQKKAPFLEHEPAVKNTMLIQFPHKKANKIARTSLLTKGNWYCKQQQIDEKKVFHHNREK